MLLPLPDQFPLSSSRGVMVPALGSCRCLPGAGRVPWGDVQVTRSPTCPPEGDLSLVCVPSMKAKPVKASGS